MRAAEPFVGRDAELDVLATHLADARQGRGAFILLAGEAGIGKTRLAQRLRDVHRAAGGASFVGTCWDDDAAAYLPWTEVLGGLVHGHASDLLGSLTSWERGALGAVLPALVLDTDTPVVTDGDHGRVLLYAAVASLLRNASRDVALLLVIEDLHAADGASLRLLRAVVPVLESLRVVIVGTVRTGDRDPGATPTALADLERTAPVLVLEGFRENDVRAYLAGRLDEEPTSDLVQRVHGVTGGNPLFVREVARLIESGQDPIIPGPVRDAVRRRIAQLGSDARAALEFAAVLGRDIDVVTIQHALDTDPGTATTLLAEAFQVGIITGGDVRGFRFTHALFRDALYVELGPRRLQLHARVAEILEHLHHAGYGGIGEVAAHYVASLPVGDPVKARDHSRTAAEVATRRGRYDEAAEFYARALSAQEMIGEDASVRARLLIDLAAARFRAGERELARARWWEAAEVARAAGDTEALADAALGLATEVHWGAPSRDRIDLLTEALEATPAEDSPRRVRLLARLAEELYWTPDRSQRRALSDEALERARRLGDDRTLGAALRGRLWAVRDPDTVDERLRNAGDLARIGEAARDPDIVQEGRYHLILALLEIGDFEAADRQLALHAHLAEELHHPVHLWRASMWRAMRALTTGPLDDAAAEVERALRLGEGAGDPNAHLSYWAQRTELGRWRGWLADDLSSIAALADRFVGLPVLRCAHALILAQNQPDRAAALLDELMPDHVLPFDSTWLGSVVLAAEASIAVRSPERARVLHDRLAPYANRFAIGGPGAVVFGPVRYTLAGISILLDRPEAAAADLRLAIEQARAAGADVWVAAAELRLAEAEGRRPGPDVVRAARRSGIALSEPAAAPPGVRAPGGTLTPRELEVLDLLGRGMSNRDIAQTLVVTEKTVKTHVSSILSKLQVADRTQAALFAVRAGLVAAQFER